MPDDIALTRGCHLSLSALAAEFGSTRETIKKRLDDANVDPSGARGGHPVYRLKDALRAWSAIENANRTPGEMPIAERGRFYATAMQELEYKRASGELVTRADMQTENARAFKIFAQEMDALPDVLERDCALTAAQAEMIQARIDAVRDNIYERLIQDDEPADTAPADASA